MIRAFRDKKPNIAERVFLAENCAVIGDVTLHKNVSLWYGAVLRADEDAIEVGENSNVQDNATLHTAKGHPVIIGKNVTVGHNAIVHGCTVGDGSLIGMGACVLNGAVIGKECLIGAGALVLENTVIPDGSLCVGAPAKVIRTLSEEARRGMLENAAEYVRLAKDHF